MRPLGIALGVAAHGAAAAVVVGSAGAFAAASWLGLFVLAVLTGGPLGGPLALPAMVLFALAFAGVSVVSVLTPATIAARLTRRRLSWPMLAEIPVAAAFCVSGSAVLAGLFAWTRELDLLRAVGVGLAVGAVLLVPLGLYWWSVQASLGLVRAASWGVGRLLPGRHSR